MELSNQDLIIFKAISGFVCALNEEMGKRYKSVALYNRLLEKTGVMHTGPILKHIDHFRQFFITNAAAMQSCKPEHMVDPKISYSSNVYIDVAAAIRHSSAEDAKVIWQHLLTIQNLIDPISAATKVLKEKFNSSDAKGNEQEFLQNIMSKVQETAEKANISESSNPAEIMTTMMQSGAMTDLMNGMYKGINDGSIDIGRIFGSLQGVLGGMGGMGGGAPDLPAGLPAGLPPPTGAGGGMPDLSAIMGMVGPMMSQIMGGMQGGGGMGGMGGMPFPPQGGHGHHQGDEKQ